MDIDYDNVLKICREIGFRYLNNQDEVQEVSQLVAIDLFNNLDKINPERINGWLFTVTKHKCFAIIKSKKNSKEVLTDTSFFNKLCSAKEMKEDTSEDELDLYKYDFISTQNKAILDRYYHEHHSIEALARAYKIKAKTLKQRIYKIEQEIKLFHLVNSNKLAFDSLPSTKLNNNLLNFLRKLKTALESNKLQEMTTYLEDCIIHDSINKINMMKFRTSKIRIIGPNKYKFLVTYINEKQQPRFFFIAFELRGKNGIHITELPIFPKEVSLIEVSEKSKKLKSKDLAGEKGWYNQKLGSTEDLRREGRLELIQKGEDI